ncbi:MAG: hypothetical protein COS42_11810 [Flavobacteriales bacterium CG03_land_8_20_14_0_80_35_15]|nr:hypothetical protein [Zetaproteobacteria bacterium]NDK17477.1 hypothetical protein [Flavobacteriales bacterium]OIO09323.1 MAG: hypothetical protein AUJ53_09515 [Flavobacteriaceae bacterium CG1_02_35_72]PIR14164.1 MAG: hypothetical protein COV50_04335 [Flavobacteriales bacterium CG11_big_fil_rev_8_21_14_0_20_35_7]PIV16087.1 MAG: hypothetical protein COS42_11810 [Flavobacteriales bacterium CG03_land_8_20_14_0_80_35_15]PIX07709.1 MAG: hypothetical protein COZ76_01970 [Flavobacteriales bacteriu
MKKLFTFLIILSILFPKNVEAQNNGAATAAVVGGLLAIGAGVAAIQQMKEQAELTATEWVLSNEPEINSFSLKTLDFDGRKLKDMSAVSVILFNIQEFKPMDKPKLDGKKQVLFGFTSQGWINEMGIDFNKVQWMLIDSSEWLKMMTSYVKVASGQVDESHIKEALVAGKIVNKGINGKGDLEIPFYKLEGDMYVVIDYSTDMKFIYNERSLGIFLKKTKDLVQIGRSEIIKIHEFFFDK